MLDLLVGHVSGGMLLLFPFSWHGWPLGLIQCDEYRIALIMGLTYKENVPDTRESPVVRIIEELKEFGVVALDELNVKMDCVIMAAAHNKFKHKLFFKKETFTKEKLFLSTGSFS